MRKMSATLGGETVELTADFAASYRIAEEVGDPLAIAREANNEAYFMSNNIPYEPKWKFTIRNVVAILHIGSALPIEKIQELCFEEGFLGAREVASDYLTKIIGPQPESQMEPADEKESKGK